MRRGLALVVAAALAGTSFAWSGSAMADEHHGHGSQDVAVYFLNSQPSGGPYLVPVQRTVTVDQGVPAEALRQLLAGPSTTEAAAGLTSAVPAGSTLRSLRVDDGVATVDLSTQFASGGGSASVFGRLAEVVYTLTRFPVIDGVRFAIAGTVVSVFPTGEGLVLPNPVTRAYFAGQGVLPAIFVDRPAWNGQFGHRLTGSTGVTGGAFTVEVKTGAGAVLTSQAVTAVNGVFDVNVPYAVTSDQAGTVTVYSGPTTARQNVRTYPVTLVAGAGAPWVRDLTHACLGPAHHPFGDVPHDSDHALAIAVAYRWGIVHGVTTSAYVPMKLVTREQAAAMVARMLVAVGVTLPAAPATHFADVALSPYRLQIEQLAQLGVFPGYPDGTFRPTQPATRAELTTVLVNAYQLRATVALAVAGDFFTDDLADAHHGAINALATAGVVTGYGDDTFGPGHQLTRADLASMLARMVDLFVASGYATAR